MYITNEMQLQKSNVNFHHMEDGGSGGFANRSKGWSMVQHSGGLAIEQPSTDGTISP